MNEKEWRTRVAFAASSRLSREEFTAYLDFLVRRGYLMETPPPFSLDGKVGPTEKFIETLGKAFSLLPPNLTEENIVPTLSLIFSLLCLGGDFPIEMGRVNPVEVGKLSRVVQALLLTLLEKERRSREEGVPPSRSPAPGFSPRKGEGDEVPRCSICTRRMRLSRRLNAYVCKNWRCPAYWKLGTGPILRITERGLVPGYSEGYRIVEGEVGR